jgi:hypothetical protein
MHFIKHLSLIFCKGIVQVAAFSKEEVTHSKQLLGTRHRQLRADIVHYHLFASLHFYVVDILGQAWREQQLRVPREPVAGAEEPPNKEDMAVKNVTLYTSDATWIRTTQIGGTRSST